MGTGTSSRDWVLRSGMPGRVERIEAYFSGHGYDPHRHDGSVTLGSGQLYVVPKGVEHKPYAEAEVKVLLIEPRGVRNTGAEGGERTALNDLWI